ncbi:MAG TPA: LysR substrate-binding domain-containing protein [Trinickia sp.]|jgi:LysR family nitrogen assimilation transcriptional regulator|nr:LysR substrate-binding domain-containing protein [Trinickia sp.]
MNLKQLDYFVRVAELGSFSQAARILDIAQPALSRQVRMLETELRCALLQRHGRGVALTEAGRRLFEHGVDILQRVALAVDDVEARRDEPTGRVVLALPPSTARLLTLPLVKRFRDELPKAKLAIVEGLSTHIAEWITTGRVDLGLVLNAEVDQAIELEPLSEEPLCLIGPAGEPSGPVVFAQLQNLRLIIPERAHTVRKLVEAQAILAGLRLQIDWEVSGVPSILDLVRHGFGHAVLPAGAVHGSGNPEAFSVRPLVQPELRSRLFLASSALKPSTPLMRHARTVLRELVNERRHNDPA